MEQTILNPVNLTAQSGASVINEKTENWKMAENSRLGVTPMILLVVIGIASIAAAFALQTSPVKVAIVTVPAALVEAMIISVMPVRAIAGAAFISVIVSLATIFI